MALVTDPDIGFTVNQTRGERPAPAQRAEGPMLGREHEFVAAGSGTARRHAAST